MKYGYCPACLDKWYRASVPRRAIYGPRPPTERLHLECEKALKSL